MIILYLRGILLSSAYNYNIMSIMYVNITPICVRYFSSLSGYTKNSVTRVVLYNTITISGEQVIIHIKNNTSSKFLPPKKHVKKVNMYHIIYQYDE